MPPGGGVGTGEAVLAGDDGLPPALAPGVPPGDELDAPNAERDGDAFADAEHATSGIARNTIATRRMITGGSPGRSPHVAVVTEAESARLRPEGEAVCAKSGANEAHEFHGGRVHERDAAESLVRDVEDLAIR